MEHHVGASAFKQSGIPLVQRKHWHLLGALFYNVLQLGCKYCIAHQVARWFGSDFFWIEKEMSILFFFLK